MAGEESDGPNALSGNKQWDPVKMQWVDVKPIEPGSAEYWRSRADAARKRLEAIYALSPDDRALQKDLMNFLEADISKSDKEFADAWQKDKDAYLKAQAAQAAAAAKASAGTGGGPVSPTIVPPGMTVIESDPAKPGSFNRYIYSMDPSGAVKKIPVAIDAQNPVTANDFMVSPNGDIFSMRSFDNTGALVPDAKPVFKKSLKYTQSTEAVGPDGVKHTYVYDPASPLDRYDMGASSDPSVKSQTDALTAQYKATTGKIGVETEAAAFKLEQDKAAVSAGEDVYRKKLTAVEAMLKLGKIDEAQKAFSEAQKTWETTASARMREKDSALTKGGEAESRAWWSQKNAAPGEATKAWAEQYASIPGAAGDSFTQRMARQQGYSDAIDYQRGNTPSWDEFLNNAPQGTYGTRSSLETPFKAPAIAGAGPTLPGGIPPGAAPPTVGAEPSAGGRSIDLGGGLYWWDDGSGSGDMFHMAPQATGLLGADGEPEMRMTPTSLDSTGVYSGKSLDEARALAHAWFGGSPQQPDVSASVSGQGQFPNSTPSEDRTMMPIPNAPLTGDPEGDRQMYGAPSGVDRYTNDGMGRTRVGMVGQYPGGLAPGGGKPVGGGGGGGSPVTTGFIEGANGNPYGERGGLMSGGYPLDLRGAGGGLPRFLPVLPDWQTIDDFNKMGTTYDPTVFNTSPPTGNGPAGNDAPWYEKARGVIPEVFRSVAAPSVSESQTPAWLRAAKTIYNYAGRVK